MPRPRPEGWDYEKPDRDSVRCRTCNHDGLNRTGREFAGWVGASTTTYYARPCPDGCAKGLVQ